MLDENKTSGETLVVEDHNQIFSQPVFVETFKNKAAFECGEGAEAVAKQLDYSKSAEYKEKNFARSALTINPAKACQPLGAILVASGFKGCLPYVHGSQGCVSYFRSHFNRHFKEPFSAVSDSMTEDAAVFGGNKNMAEGLKNALALYKPEMIAVSTTCMAEVIGDDLNAFIGNAKKDGAIPTEFPVPYAHTPSFVGSHVTGYDQMMRGFMFYFTKDNAKAAKDNGKINLIPGFDPFTVANIPAMKDMLSQMGVEYTVLGDNSEILNTPMDGHYQMYAGGTTIAEVTDAKNAKATFTLLPDSTSKVTASCVKDDWEQEFVELTPMGISGTDQFLMKVSEITGKEIPDSLAKERGQALDAMADSNYYLHGKRFSIFGDPSYVEALVDFYMELGAEPLHIVVSNSTKKWGRALQKKLDASEFGKQAQVHHGADLWHLRSLMFEEKPDFLVGSTYGKQLALDVGVPLVRIGFPIFDRHHLHRYSTFGYKGVINLLTWTVNTLLDDLDRKATFNNDFVR
ncbi:MAG: nitrogenase molybdenum-iron protein subunit beta [Candidatus Lambdaproteobacteria bacterium RIFOXYD2_FULL_50_16]|uniref:Nitrogenase molybdenum-iron protein beta chain n=1 Tax=Candidatus Lambdaproteobacteria bacterium RIFOXYD2_FULL_50_16 TaxID=1817772 RepID=A0A1F6G8S0_9PROT|nr:MAG: nitrogenase molybdenum-iron protein subunit beta [Candidatus Lambdaproteobacteria bacterium RIFOXYD2_FULL_50_16]